MIAMFLAKCLTSKYAAEVVIGIRLKSKVAKILFGSSAQHVILDAPCPLVNIR
jgi:nucleotide-binding universal stress UspA family protein